MIQSLLDLLESSAQSSSKIVCYTKQPNSQELGVNTITYTRLLHDARTRADWLCRQPTFRVRKPVLIHFDNHKDNILWFWTVVLADGIPVMSTPLSEDETARALHLAHLQRLLLNPIVLTSKELADVYFQDTKLPVLAVDNFLESTTSVTGGDCPADHARSDDCSLSDEVNTDTSTEGVAAMMLTSGSSGAAKAVCLSHAQMLASVRGKFAAMPSPKGTSLLNWIAFDHVASLVEIHLCAMMHNLDQVHVPANQLIAQPLLFLKLITDHAVSRSFAPHFFLARLLREIEDCSDIATKGINLSKLYFIGSGGEPNTTDVCRHLSERLRKLGCRRNVIVPGFGMTETCAGAIYSLQCPDIDVEAGEHLASLGKCVPGIEMRVPGPQRAPGDTTPSDLHGELQVRGPIVFQRYFNNPQATAEAFSIDGWFKTGDIARIDALGNLRLSGRSKDVININGVKYVPSEIELAINNAHIDGIEPTYVVCFGHRRENEDNDSIYVLYQRSYEANDATRLAVRDAIGRLVLLFARVWPIVLPLPHGCMEKTSLGKISKAKLRQKYLAGVFEEQESENAAELELHASTSGDEAQTETETQLLDVLRHMMVTNKASMGRSTSILSTGITSVELIRLKSICQTTFGIDDIPLLTFLANSTVSCLATAIDDLGDKRTKEESYNPVVTVQPDGVKTPLWLVHPGIGEMLVFFGLAQYFTDRPVHTFRARGFNDGEAPFKDLTEVLDTYYTALRKTQPEGPYAIAGYSYGSMIAFELAKRLEADGAAVQFLGSFNLPPHIKDRMRMLDWTNGLLHIAHFCAILTEERSEQMVGDLLKLSKPEQVQRVIDESDQKRLGELALTHSGLLRWTDVSWSLQRIGWDYEPSGNVSDIHVFFCQPLKIVARTREEYRRDKLERWKDFVSGQVRFHEVDGEHYTMIGSEHVGKFQATLKDAMSQCGL